MLLVVASHLDAPEADAADTKLHFSLICKFSRVINSDSLSAIHNMHILHVILPGFMLLRFGLLRGGGGEGRTTQCIHNTHFFCTGHDQTKSHKQ